VHAIQTLFARTATTSTSLRPILSAPRVLTTLGRFVAAAAPAPVTARLAASTLELLRTPQVAAHPQPFVRRAALYAAAEVCTVHLTPDASTSQQHDIAGRRAHPCS
jgi:hypothetical protein